MCSVDTGHSLWLLSLQIPFQCPESSPLDESWGRQRPPLSTETECQVLAFLGSLASGMLTGDSGVIIHAPQGKRACPLCLLTVSRSVWHAGCTQSVILEPTNSSHHSLLLFSLPRHGDFNTDLPQIGVKSEVTAMKSVIFGQPTYCYFHL